MTENRTHPDGRRTQTRAFYDTVADSYAALLPDTRAEAPLDLGMIAQFAAALPDSDAPVLDAGCGTGRMLTHLASLGVSPLAGIDLSPAMVRRSRAAHTDVSIWVADLTALPLSDAAVRGILCWYSIIHSDPAEVGIILGEAYRVLTPGGLLLLGFQSGIGERRVERAYGHDVSIRAVLHDVAVVSRAAESKGFDLAATAERAAGHGEKHAQGFVLAAKR